LDITSLGAAHLWEQLSATTTAVVTVSSPVAAQPLSVGCSSYGNRRAAGGTAPRSWHRTGLLQTEPDQGTPWAHTETKPKSPSPRCIKRNWQMMLAVKTSCLLGIRHEFLPVGRTILTLLPEASVKWLCSHW